MRRSRTAGPTRRAIVIDATALALLVSVVACGTASRGARDGGRSPAGSRETSAWLSADDFDRGLFHAPTTIDNPWLPLVPGTRWTWDGHALDGSERVGRGVIITVTDLTKVVDGVLARVVYDLDLDDGRVEEAEIALFAQDDRGVVWHFGQYPEEYDGGEVVKTPTWVAGLEHAKPGITMQAIPGNGEDDYSEGWGPAVGWNDRAQTYAVGERTCVPVDCYSNVLVVREFSRTEPGAYQLKYYAPGVGNVRVGWGGAKEDEHEVLVLTALEHLSPAELRAVDARVMAQERRARARSDVWALTAPIERAG
jgi:hypothetical protein